MVFTRAKWRRRCCWRRCRNWWTARRTPSNYIADVAKPEMLLPENAPATFAWLTRDIAASGVMGDPRPATRGKRRALDRTSGDTAGRGARGDGALFRVRAETT